MKAATCSIVFPILFLSVLFAWNSVPVLADEPGAKDPLPNIVLIISDDQAWTDYGFMGHPDIQTPRLDQLARESLTFTRGYVPTSLCRPSLATIITGLYPVQHFITGNDPALPKKGDARKNRSSAEYLQLRNELRSKIKSLPTLPRRLKSKGYVSHQSGKWWEGSFGDGGFTHGMTHGDLKRGGRHGDEGLKIGREGLQPIFDFIDGAGEKPFFIWYAPFLPHTPHNPPARLLEKYKRADRPLELAKYYAMCEWFDETCGELVDHIDERGLGENTLFLYVTDNGWIQKTPLTDVPEGWGKGFAPGSKQSPSDGGIRTPIMLRWKGRIEPKLDTNTLVSSIDLAPTVLDAVGLEKSQRLMGKSLLPLADGKAWDRTEIFGEIYAHDIADINDPQQSLLYRWGISGHDKLIKFYDGKTGRYGNIHRHMQGNRQPQLYNLETDPNETEDLYQQRREDAIALEQQISKHFAAVEKKEQAGREQSFSEQDRLRGSITPERAWWDLKHYHLQVEFDPENKSIRGSNRITYEVLEPGRSMQIDLQHPLEITDVKIGDRSLPFQRNGNVFLIKFEQDRQSGARETIEVFYQGTPVESKNPPWSGGITWQRDNLGHHFIATSCQGIGASIWWPCKDHGYDEPDDGMRTSITVPESLTAVSNGRLKQTSHDQDAATKTFHWEVVNPINNYCINANIGNYVNFSDVYEGEFGKLDLDYWVLDHQREVAENHFKEVPRTIEAFEHWFGKYPFYQDSYKLVVVPYLGMEHQSSVTYGNGFKNGYRGRDLSGTGVGLKFDFIIVHESGHEWFGNNISMKDAADMWIHEGFTNYSENLFVDYHFTTQEAEDYVIGCRRLISNDRPIIGVYGVNKSGSGDMYYKGGNLLHTMRQIIGDDEKWRKILRGLNREFWHQTVTTEQVENYIIEQSGFDFGKYFDQYLRTTEIPILKYRIDGNKVSYRFENVVDGFSIPVEVRVNHQEQVLRPTDAWKSLTCEQPVEVFEVDRNYYIETEQAPGGKP